MLFGSGRKEAPEWTDVLQGDNTSQVTYKHCDAKVSAKIERIRAHLAKCPKYCSEEPSETMPTSSESSCSRKAGPSSVKRKQTSLGEFVGKTTD